MGGRMQPLFDPASVSLLPPSDTWKADMEKQNQDKIDNPDIDESEIENEETPMDSIGANDNEEADIDFTMATVDVQEEHERVLRIRNDIIAEKTLNRKQEKAFELSTDNVIKR